MDYFISDTAYALEYYQADNVTMLKLARELREEIKDENKHNNLRQTKNYCDSNELFSNDYKPAIYNAFVFVKDQYNIKELYSFLCNLQKEMNIKLLPKNN